MVIATFDRSTMKTNERGLMDEGKSGPIDRHSFAMVVRFGDTLVWLPLMPCISDVHNFWSTERVLVVHRRICHDPDAKFVLCLIALFANSSRLIRPLATENKTASSTLWRRVAHFGYDLINGGYR